MVGANVACGECYYCRHDFPSYCSEKITDYGNDLSAKNPPHLFGGWSQYMYIVPGSFLVKVPDDLPSEVAVLTEIFAVSVGLARAEQMSAFPNESFRFDDTVVVLGVGPLGMCFLMKARMLGAAPSSQWICRTSGKAWPSAWAPTHHQRCQAGEASESTTHPSLNPRASRGHGH